MGRDCNCPPEQRSPSAIGAWWACKRKWGFAKLDGIRSESTEKQALGTDMHKQAEDFLTLGKPLDLTRSSGEIALAGADLWPVGERTARCETHFRAGPFHGFSDITSIGPSLADPDRRIPLVWDHKTTSDFMWAKTPVTLLQDPQGAISAHAALTLTGSPLVGLRWIYYRTRGAKRRLPVFVDVTRQDIAPTMDRIFETVAEMAAIPKGTRALDLPPSPSACDAYGGCEHISRCNLSPHERMIGIMTQANAMQGAQSHNELLQQLAGGQPAAPQGAPYGAVNGPPPPPQGQPMQGPPPDYASAQGQQAPNMPVQQWQQPAPPQGPPQGYAPPPPPAYGPPSQGPHAYGAPPPQGPPPGYAPQGYGPPQGPPPGYVPAPPPPAEAGKAKRGRPRGTPGAKANFVKAGTAFIMAIADLIVDDDAPPPQG